MTTRSRAWVMAGVTLIALGVCTLMGGWYGDAVYGGSTVHLDTLSAPIGMELGLTLRQILA